MDLPFINSRDALIADLENSVVRNALLLAINLGVRVPSIASPLIADAIAAQSSAMAAFVRNEVAALVASSPAALDTLNELAAAIGNDPNFAATIIASLATKADATAVVAKVDAGQISGHRNRLANPDFTIAQRGVGPFAASGYNLDRWRASHNGAFTVSRVDLGYVDTGPAGPARYAYQMTITTAATATALLMAQRIEGVHTFSGGQATLTIWASFPNGKALTPRLVQNFGVGGSASVTVTGAQIIGTGALKRYDMVFDVPSVAGKAIGSGDSDYLQAEIVELANWTAGWQFQCVKTSIVRGDARTENDPGGIRHQATEMAICQRYYQTLGVGVAVWSVGPTSVRFCSAFPRMRAVPTLTLLDPAPQVILINSSAQATASVLSSGVFSPDAARGALSGFTGLTAGQPGSLFSANVISLDAEL